jgi:hypothetical protein
MTAAETKPAFKRASIVGVPEPVKAILAKHGFELLGRGEVLEVVLPMDHARAIEVIRKRLKNINRELKPYGVCLVFHTFLDDFGWNRNGLYSLKFYVKAQDYRAFVGKLTKLQPKA